MRLAAARERRHPRQSGRSIPAAAWCELLLQCGLRLGARSLPAPFRGQPRWPPRRSAHHPRAVRASGASRAALRRRSRTARGRSAARRWQTPEPPAEAPGQGTLVLSPPHARSRGPPTRVCRTATVARVHMSPRVCHTVEAGFEVSASSGRVFFAHAGVRILCRVERAPPAADDAHCVQEGARATTSEPSAADARRRAAGRPEGRQLQSGVGADGRALWKASRMVRAMPLPMSPNPRTPRVSEERRR
eukprot:2900038-Prymnesium_polylepis.1